MLQKPVLRASLGSQPSRVLNHVPGQYDPTAVVTMTNDRCRPGLSLPLFLSFSAFWGCIFEDKSTRRRALNHQPWLALRSEIGKEGFPASFTHN